MRRDEGRIPPAFIVAVVNVESTGKEEQAQAPWWLWANRFCLDVPLIAVFWQEVFAQVWEVRLFPAERALLFLAVWGLYLADRMLDSLRAGAPTNGRHRAVGANRLLFGFLAILCFGFAAWLALSKIPVGALTSAFPLALIVGGYGIWRHLGERRGGISIGRSVVVAALFASGSMVLPLGLLLQIPIGMGPLWGAFTAVLFLNHRIVLGARSVDVAIAILAAVAVLATLLIFQFGMLIALPAAALLLCALLLGGIAAWSFRRVGNREAVTALAELSLALPPLLALGAGWIVR